MNSIACDRECFEQWRAGEAEISPDPLRADFTIRLPYHRSHFLLRDAAKAMEEAGREPLQPSCVVRAAADDLAQVERVLREFSGSKDPLADAAGDAAKKVRAVVAEIVEAAFAGEDRVHKAPRRRRRRSAVVTAARVLAAVLALCAALLPVTADAVSKVQRDPVTAEFFAEGRLVEIVVVEAGDGFELILALGPVSVQLDPGEVAAEIRLGDCYRVYGRAEVGSAGRVVSRRALAVDPVVCSCQ